jgi:hypothetical protein
VSRHWITEFTRCHTLMRIDPRGVGMSDWDIGELSFDAIVSSGLMMPPDVLAANINRIRQGAAKFAQNHFTVAQELHPEVTGRVLGASTIFGPALGKGGIYSDVWTLPVSPAAGGNTPVGMVKVKHSSGRTTTVDRATADQMIKDDPANFSEVK